jgi:hypothetical protein
MIFSPRGNSLASPDGGSSDSVVSFVKLAIETFQKLKELPSFARPGQPGRLSPRGLRDCIQPCCELIAES